MCSSPLCVLLYCFQSLGIWPKTFLHIMSSRVLTIFAVTAVLRRHTWQKTLHTHCIPAPPLLLYRVYCTCIFIQQHLCPCTLFAAEPCCHFWVRQASEWYTVGVCIHVHPCAVQYICAGVGGWTRHRLPVGRALSWPLGDTRGPIGRCECFKSFVGALCCLLSQTSPSEVAMIMEAYSGDCCLNCFSVWHLNAQWRHFWTKLSLIVALAQVEADLQSFEQNHGF